MQGMKRKAVSTMLSTDLPKAPGIYKIYFLDPDFFYIGSSINLRNRYYGHIKDLRNSRHGNSHLQHAYDKYGKDALHFEIVEQVSHREDLLVREQHYLDTLKPYYNIHPNARSSLGVKRTPEHRIKSGAAHRGKPSWNKGKKLSLEHIEHLSVSHKGKPSPTKGKPCPPEIIEKLRIINTGRPNPHPGNHAPRGPLRPEAKESLIAKRRAILEAKSPEERAQTLEKFRATQAAKTPEQRAQEIEKWRASRAANKARKQANEQVSLWDDESVS
jgi:group I intron endonuclease